VLHMSRHSYSRLSGEFPMSNMHSGSRLGKNAEIQEKIAQLARRNEKLERVVVKMGTKADTSDFRSRLEKDLRDVNSLAKDLLRSLNDNRGADQEMMKRLTQDFTREFKKFQQLNEQIKSKDSQIMRAMSHRERSNSDLSGSSYRDDRDHFANLQQQQQRQAGLQEQEVDIEFLEYDAEEIENRHQRIQDIERDVLEVNEMFRDLQAIVHDQGETINVISDNIGTTLAAVGDAHEELVKAETYQKKARRKQCCLLFLILAVGLALGLGIWLGTK